VIDKFARLAIGLSILCIVICAIQAFALRMQVHFQFHHILEESESKKIADELVENQLPYVVLGGVLNAAGLFAAISLLRRQNWARIMWIALCVISTGLALVSFCREHDWIIFSAVLFRIGILVVSMRVLCSATAKTEFLR